MRYLRSSFVLCFAPSLFLCLTCMMGILNRTEDHAFAGPVAGRPQEQWISTGPMDSIMSQGAGRPCWTRPLRGSRGSLKDMHAWAGTPTSTSDAPISTATETASGRSPSNKGQIDHPLDGAVPKPSSTEGNPHVQAAWLAHPQVTRDHLDSTASSTSTI